MLNDVFLRFATSLLLFASLLSPAVNSLGQTPSLNPTLPGTEKTPLPSSTSVEALQTQIRERIDRPELRRGQVGIKVASLATGKVLFDQNSEKYFMPASNMKNFTVATALEKLTPDYRFVTGVYAAAMPDADGTIRGDVWIVGRGDVSISTAFNSPSEPIRNLASKPDVQEIYFKGIDKLIDRLLAAGVKRIEGSIVGDDSYFKGGPIPDTWEWDDLQAYFGAEVSALPVNDNAVDFSVTPGPVGYPCTVKMMPFNPLYRIRNACLTTAAGSPRTLRLTKALGQNQLDIAGTLPAGNAGFNGSIAVSRPAELFAALTRQRLEQRGVVVTGQYRVPSGTYLRPDVEIAKLDSPPLALIAAKTMKPSQNMYTETLLWTLGEEARKRIASTTVQPAPASPPSSAALGISEVKNFLVSIGVAPDAVVQYDGSGLSRHNLITPAAVVQLYTYMAKQSRSAQAWRDSLTIGGVDGTLANRFKGTIAQGNIRGKTGTIDQVSALSGYMTTAGGDELVVSFVVNGVPATRDRTSMIDDVVLMLARFSGKID